MSWKEMLMATAVASADPEISDDATDVAVITEDDVRIIRMIVREQLAAFRTGDADRAWRLSSIGIRSTFPAAEQLLQLIRQRYAPLCDPRQVVFGEFGITPEGLGVRIEVVGRDLQRYHFMYLVVHDHVAGWQVNGCVGLQSQELLEAA